MARKGFWAIETRAIRFGRDGRWYSDDEPIENHRIADLFSRHVTRGADGSFWLVIGDERQRITVDDTAWVVTRVDGDPANGFTIQLNDGSREPLAAPSLRFGEGDVLYCDARRPRERVRFLRAPQIDLLRHVEEAGGHFLLPLPGGERQELRPGSAG